MEIFRWTGPASLLVACSSDCIYYPCPDPEAGISVTASTATAGIPGLTLALSVAVVGSAPCRRGSGAASVCYVLGGQGSYQAALSAPGYQTADIKFLLQVRRQAAIRAVTWTANCCPL